MKAKKRLWITIKGKRSLLPEQAMLATVCGLLRYAARVENVRHRSVTIHFCDDDTIRRYNRQYRQIDKVTDVLSFPLEPYDFEVLPGLPLPSLGDIVVSLPRCKAQAAEYGHSYERELCFLTLHGFLHLLGYDHETIAERMEMEARAETILAARGCLR